jgi:hypothetical protein
MKTIYLQDENYNWQQFQYENIDQLKCEFENRKIQIGSDCEIGSDCKIGSDCCLGKRAKIEEKISLLKSIYIIGSNLPLLMLEGEMYQLDVIHIQLIHGYNQKLLVKMKDILMTRWKSIDNIS